jgi:DNA polymerase-1
VFAVPPELVDNEMRRRAKVINFGILYGMGVNALQQTLGTGRSEAQQFLSDYFKQFFGIRHYVEGVKSAVAHTGYTETFFGSRRYFDGIRSPLPYIKAQAERMAINAPIQGTQADIIKIAMARIDTYLQKEHLLDDCRLLLQVHDELVYEIRTSKKAALIPEVKKIMESVMTLDETKGITLIAEAKEGKNWGEMERVG